MLQTRSHLELTATLKRKFPALFEFEECGVMFLDEKSQELFSFTLDETLSKVNNIVRYTTNSGMSGQSIRTNKVLHFQEGRAPANYSNEVDNINKIAKVESLLVCPVFFGKTLKAVI